MERVRQKTDREAWERFVKLYSPLLYHWVQKTGFDKKDSADLVQEVFVTLLDKLPQFHYDPSRSFRAWLRTLAVNKWHELRRRRVVGNPAGDAMTEPAIEDPAAEFWESEYRDYLVRRALLLMQSDFGETVWQSCWRTVVDGQSAPEVAAALGTTPGAVHAAKCRVLARLRQELAGLLDD
jgi:RNA polymerase sigma-70 factor (ECF subfamily)